MSSEFRAYLKAKGANPEIDTCYYELSSQQKFHGMWNCEVLTLGFTLGSFTKQMLFRPIDQKKPVVFAINGDADGVFFIVVDAHTPEEQHGYMVNFKPFKTDNFLIACDDGGGIGSGTSRPRNYWTIKTGGETYAYGHAFPDTWQLSSVDPLCAFVGGGMTANQLRATAYRQQRAVVKEERREARIKSLVLRAEDFSRIIDKQARHFNNLYDQNKVMWILIEKIQSVVKKSALPGVLRSKLLNLLKSFDVEYLKTQKAWNR